MEMSRPPEDPENKVGVQSYLTAAAAHLKCQSALVEGPAAARAALAKHGASIPAELAQALEIVGGYATNEHRHSSLHVAVVNGDAATVEALVVAGPRLIDVKDSNGATPLDLATDDTCRDILEHHAAVYASITEDPTTLVVAALAHCATFSASEERLPATALSLRARYFDPCFLWAPPAARSAVVAWARDALIAQHAGTTQPFERLQDDPAGDVLEIFGMAMTRTDALHIAQHCSSPEARAWVRAVIAPAVMEKATADLVPAAEEGDLATVQDCLSKKANIETNVNGETALMKASTGGHTATVEVLLEAGADKDAKDENGETALIWASTDGHTATVQVLLKAGANKEAKDNVYGNTALIMASIYGHTATVEVLLEAGADKEARNVNSNTALMEASANGRTATVQVLLGAGADKEAKGRGWTALMYASENGHTATVEVLLGAGADKEARNVRGKTALDLAKSNDHSAVVALLGHCQTV